MVFPPVRKEEETDRSDEFLFKSVTRTFERSRYLVAQFVGRAAPTLHLIAHPIILLRQGSKRANPT